MLRFFSAFLFLALAIGCTKVDNKPVESVKPKKCDGDKHCPKPCKPCPKEPCPCPPCPKCPDCPNKPCPKFEDAETVAKTVIVGTVKKITVGENGGLAVTIDNEKLPRIIGSDADVTVNGKVITNPKDVVEWFKNAKQPVTVKLTTSPKRVVGGAIKADFCDKG